MSYYPNPLIKIPKEQNWNFVEIKMPLNPNNTQNKKQAYSMNDDRIDELTNIIIRYAIENKMSFKNISKAVEQCKEIFLESGLVK